MLQFTQVCSTIYHVQEDVIRILAGRNPSIDVVTVTLYGFNYQYVFIQSTFQNTFVFCPFLT